MALPKQMTTVTQASKILALILFISLPIIFFGFGMKYQRTIDAGQLKSMPSVTPTLTPPASS